jgi:hypothetical protein
VGTAIRSIVRISTITRRDDIAAMLHEASTLYHLEVFAGPLRSALSSSRWASPYASVASSREPSRSSQPPGCVGRSNGMGARGQLPGSYLQRPAQPLGTRLCARAMTRRRDARQRREYGRDAERFLEVQSPSRPVLASTTTAPLISSMRRMT